MYLRIVGAISAAFVLMLLTSSGAGAETSGGHVPPVDRPIVDPWRPPLHLYGSGNRGIDYGTEPGDVVGASAAGEVVFAGLVGSSVHVVVLHADGIRTSYSFLASASVSKGDHVDQGQAIGVAAGPFHFGARMGGVYIDPTTLFLGPPQVHLVATTSDPDPSGTINERVRLLADIGSALEWGAGPLAWVRAGATTTAAHLRK